MPITSLILSGEFYRPDEKMPDEDTFPKVIEIDSNDIIKTEFTKGGFHPDGAWTSAEVIPPQDIRFWSYDMTIKEA